MSVHTKRVVYGAMLAATAFVLTLVTRLQIFPSASFLEYEAGDVPLFLSAVILGPWTGLLITAVACVLQGITISASSGIIGIIMHFLSTGSFVLVAGLRQKTHGTSRNPRIFMRCIDNGAYNDTAESHTYTRFYDKRKCFQCGGTKCRCGR